MAIIQIPGSGKVPHVGFKDALWFCMDSMKLEGQTTGNRGGGIVPGSTGDTFKFLAPDTFAETIAHSWEAYESVASRLAEKIRGVAKVSEEAKGLLRIPYKKMALDAATGKLSGKTVETAMTEVGKMSSTVPKTKIDTPLVYTSSERREWNLSFTFVASGKSPEKEIVYPIKQLMKLSSPSMAGGNVFIEFPWIFRLRTEPGNLVLSNYTALTSVQPTWKAPYRNGYPIAVELTLTFKDLSPLFKETIERGSLVTVGPLQKN